MSARRVTRRSLTATAVTTGALAASQHALLARGLPLAALQDDDANTDLKPEGYVSTRLRTLADEDDLDKVNDAIVDGFIPEVEELDGFKGYLLATVRNGGVPQSLSIVILGSEDQIQEYNDHQTEFIKDLGDDFNAVHTVQFQGQLLIRVKPGEEEAPSGTPEPRHDGYVSVHARAITPATPEGELPDLVTSGLLPEIDGIPGLNNFLWYPTAYGYVSIALFDSSESLEEFNATVENWPADALADLQTDDNEPEIINANIVYSNLPILSEDTSGE